MDPASLPTLNLPPCELRLRVAADGEAQIFDPLRGKWLHLTPEEHVRQAFLAWMRDGLGYPAGLTATEVGLRLNGTLKRSDIVVFDRSRRPLVIVECKAPSVAITRAVFDQIVRYNMALRARLLIVTNGLRHYAVSVDYASRTTRFLPSIPPFPTLTAPSL